MTRRTEDDIKRSMYAAFESVSPQIRVDAEKGPFFNLATQAIAKTLDPDNADVERLAQLSTFQFPSNATEDEALGSARAFAVGADDGGFASGVVNFYTSRRPVGGESFDVAEGVIVSTSAVSSQAQAFVTVETKSLTAANADQYFNATNRRYEIPVSVQALTSGSAANVAANTVRNITTGGLNFEGVYNPARFEDGSDAGTFSATYERMQQKLLGLDQFSVGGLKSTVQNLDPNRVKAVELIYSTEYPVLYPRLPDGPGVDVVVVDTAQSTSVTETFVALGGETEYVFLKKPVLGLTSVSINGTPVSAALILDTSREYGRSTKETSKVTFPSALTAGDNVEVVYTYDRLMETIQNSLVGYGASASGSVDAAALFSTDALVRYPTSLAMVVKITGTVLGTFDPTSIEQEVSAVAATFVEEGTAGSPLIGGVRKPEDLRDAVQSTVPGIATLRIDVFCRKVIGNIVEVISVPRNSYPVFEATADLEVKFT